MTLPTFTFPIYLPNHFTYTDFYPYIYQITLPSPTDFTITYFSPYIYQINLKILTFPRIFAKFFKQLVSLWSYFYTELFYWGAIFPWSHFSTECFYYGTFLHTPLHINLPLWIILKGQVSRMIKKMAWPHHWIRNFLLPQKYVWNFVLGRKLWILQLFF